jgi:hypothetical protein
MRRHLPKWELIVMAIGLKLVRIAAVLGAAALLPAPPISAQDVCASQDKRQACSMQCCGRRSCPPSCEVDCVKSCVDACASPASVQAHNAKLREMQIRCGNKSAK